MSDIKVDKFDEVYTNLMDSVLELAIQLADFHPDDLTKEETTFLKSFDEYMNVLEELN